ncbi:MAG TPA: MOSC domain-containing protein [Pyrinomonadaceae bacterium]|nr:MOSC domain-containing protein [Pyrinomonadaceae bacterium]
MITTLNHLTMAQLEAALEHILESPKDNGVVDLIVRRPCVDQREVVDEAQLDVKDGLVGDSWMYRGSSKTSDGGPHPEMQITIMNSRVVALVAQDKERWPLAGDQLFIEMDLSNANLPAGSRIAIGSAIIQVTAPPHLGCQKFVARFGADAMKFVNSAVGRELCMRGVHARVVQNGVVRAGDIARKVQGVSTDSTD